MERLWRFGLAGLSITMLGGCIYTSQPSIAYDSYNPTQRAVGGALLGAGTGAAIGGLAGGGRGATAGALIGGAVGAIGGATTGSEAPSAPYYAPSPQRYYAPQPGAFYEQ